MFRIVPVITPIDNVINAMMRLANRIFGGSSVGDGFMRLLIQTIINNPLLLISLSLTMCGFVIGILKRIIMD